MAKGRQKPKGKRMVETLRAAIKASGLTHYAIGKACGFNPYVLDRFMSEKDPGDLKLATAAKVAEVLGLELRKRDS
jgi:hypothetical protein